MTRKTKVIDGVRYYADRPASCEECYFWTNRRSGCTLGRERCYYLARRQKRKKSVCEGCPYGPCISFCMNKVLGRGEVPANA